MRFWKFTPRLAASVLSFSIISCTTPKPPRPAPQISQEVALNWIKDYAKDFCEEAPAESSLAELSLEIGKDGKFLQLLERIGINVTTEIKTTLKKTSGVLQQHLAAVMISTNQCRTEVLGVTSRLIRPIYSGGSEINRIVGKDYLIQQIKLPVSKMYTSERSAYLVQSIPKIPGGISCNELVPLLEALYTSDVLEVIGASAPFIQRPLDSACLNAVLDLVYTSDVPRATSILQNTKGLY